MLRRLYDRTMALAGHRHALAALAGVSFVESSVFPVPPDVLMVPMILARRERAFLIATVATLASVAGGAFGYALGYFLYDAVGEPVLALYGYTEEFATFREAYQRWGAWAVLFAGVTPFPYKVITILSGLTALDFTVFMASSLIARAARFFVEAALLWRFGPPIRDFIERRLGMVTTLFLTLLIGGFIIARYAL